jgi:hypothetical protein
VWLILCDWVGEWSDVGSWLGGKDALECAGVVRSIIEKLKADQREKRIQDLLFQLNKSRVSYWPSR